MFVVKVVCGNLV
ncbi:hypothetical protein M2H05_22670 [Vibrio vulnificus]|nr:hypothetical protein [Vibrio vulnificus]MCU8326411.1 hypothetical protein [Vibrio vulnificus]MCU8382538.1 hypothetical protein [Vibrio vulnificus]